MYAIRLKYKATGEIGKYNIGKVFPSEAEAQKVIDQNNAARDAWDSQLASKDPCEFIAVSINHLPLNKE